MASPDLHPDSVFQSVLTTTLSPLYPNSMLGWSVSSDLKALNYHLDRCRHGLGPEDMVEGKGKAVGPCHGRLDKEDLRILDKSTGKELIIPLSQDP